jgi:NTP pyrophosphatase (non-canonical NTP hydrolase)
MSTNLNDKERCELERRMQAHVDQITDEPGDGPLKVEPLEKGFMESDVFPAREFRSILLGDRKARLEKLMPNAADPPITFEEYQAGAKKTAIYNQDARVLYPALGLPGEVGEVLEKAVNLLMMAVHAGKCANQVKKIIRDDDCECDTPRKDEIGKEIGGVLWYCAAVASDLDLGLGDIAQENLDILESRLERGTIKGDGDNR